MRLLTWMVSAFLMLPALAVGPGDMPSEILLEYADGQKVEGGAFNTNTMPGKVSVIFYVDPDEKDTNEDFSQALAAKNYDLAKYASYAIINMAATWLPNFAIASSLKEKQKMYPRTIYVMDMRKNFVKKWDLKDDSSVIVILDKSGKVIYRHDGKMGQDEISKAISLIEANLNA